MNKVRSRIENYFYLFGSPIFSEVFPTTFVLFVCLCSSSPRWTMIPKCDFTVHIDLQCFFRSVKTYIVQMQLDFSYRQFSFIFWKLHLSNAILLFILKLGAYLTLRTRLTYFAMHIFCILFLNFGTLSGYLWYTFGLLLVQSLASIHVCVASCIVLLCATITTR